MEIKFIDLNIQYQNIKKEIDDAIKKVIRESSFIGGEEINRFENNFANLIGTKYSISCGNGTDALYIAMKALNLSPGQEVITTAHSWIATSEAISQTGAKPVFVDTEEDSFCINTKLIEEKITKNTVGIVPVHLYGQSCEMDSIKNIAKKYNLWIIEDCAQSHLAEYKGIKVGNFGNLSTFSFYPGKNLGAMGDAGCINTNSKELADWCRLFARHGGKNNHAFEGINSRMDGIQAAILNAKINHIQNWTKSRIKKALYYNQSLQDIIQLTLPKRFTHSKHVYHLYTIKTNHRDELKNFLLSKGIQTKVNYPTILPLLPAYKFLDKKNTDFPVSSKYQNEILSLPLYPEISIEAQNYIIENIKKFFKLI
tara:strand:- start:9752 stop:10855 length:1104 start_codon:yes stop_codon:yes gene_type:complete